MNNSSDIQDWLNVNESAKFLGISRQTLDRHKKDKLIPPPIPNYKNAMGWPIHVLERRKRQLDAERNYRRKK
ncbi:AlpA family transcriptional regulator [Paraferrimonas sp. SM1919]|uniref:helix-turn-helix transcriptional regulator n=1 Tax=Paraferrimonas sp. SM1919 TaxID=2662263 RepID=UPI0013D6C9D1|nr:hypothetical protein [Paraferrimonas sp. SM1919]